MEKCLNKLKGESRSWSCAKMSVGILEMRKMSTGMLWKVERLVIGKVMDERPN